MNRDFFVGMGILDRGDDSRDLIACALEFDFNFWHAVDLAAATDGGICLLTRLKIPITLGDKRAVRVVSNHATARFPDREPYRICGFTRAVGLDFNGVVFTHNAWLRA